MVERTLDATAVGDEALAADETVITRAYADALKAVFDFSTDEELLAWLKKKYENDFGRSNVRVLLQGSADPENQGEVLNSTEEVETGDKEPSRWNRLTNWVRKTVASGSDRAKGWIANFPRLRKSKDEALGDSAAEAAEAVDGGSDIAADSSASSESAETVEPPVGEEGEEIDEATFRERLKILVAGLKSGEKLPKWANLDAIPGKTQVEKLRNIEKLQKVPWQTLALMGARVVAKGKIVSLMGLIGVSAPLAAPVAAGLVAGGLDFYTAARHGAQAHYLKAVNQRPQTPEAGSPEAEMSRKKKWLVKAPLAFLGKLGRLMNTPRSLLVEATYGVTRDRSKVSQFMDELEPDNAEQLRSEGPDVYENQYLLNLEQLLFASGDEGKKNREQILRIGKRLNRLAAISSYGEIDRNDKSGRLGFNKVNAEHNSAAMQKLHQELQEFVDDFNPEQLNEEEKKFVEQWNKHCKFEDAAALKRGESRKWVAAATGAVGTAMTLGIFEIGAWGVANLRDLDQLAAMIKGAFSSAGEKVSEASSSVSSGMVGAVETANNWTEANPAPLAQDGQLVQKAMGALDRLIHGGNADEVIHDLRHLDFNNLPHVDLDNLQTQIEQTSPFLANIYHRFQELGGMQMDTLHNLQHLPGELNAELDRVKEFAALVAKVSADPDTLADGSVDLIALQANFHDLSDQVLPLIDKMDQIDVSALHLSPEMTQQTESLLKATEVALRTTIKSLGRDLDNLVAQHHALAPDAHDFTHVAMTPDDNVFGHDLANDIAPAGVGVIEEVPPAPDLTHGMSELHAADAYNAPEHVKDVLPRVSEDFGVQAEGLHANSNVPEVATHGTNTGYDHGLYDHLRPAETPAADSQNIAEVQSTSGDTLIDHLKPEALDLHGGTVMLKPGETPWSVIEDQIAKLDGVERAPFQNELTKEALADHAIASGQVTDPIKDVLKGLQHLMNGGQTVNLDNLAAGSELQLLGGVENVDRLPELGQSVGFMFDREQLQHLGQFVKEALSKQAESGYESLTAAQKLVADLNGSNDGVPLLYDQLTKPQLQQLLDIANNKV